MAEDRKNVLVVAMTVIEARALLDVVGLANESGIIEKEQSGPIDWVMTRINRLLIEKLESDRPKDHDKEVTITIFCCRCDQKENRKGNQKGNIVFIKDTGHLCPRCIAKDKTIIYPEANSQ